MAGRLPLQNPLTWICRSGAPERRVVDADIFCELLTESGIGSSRLCCGKVAKAQIFTSARELIPGIPD